MRHHVHLLALALPLVASAAHASLFTYSDSFTASGSIGSSTFTDQAVTLALTADPTTAYYNLNSWVVPSDANTVITATIGSTTYTLTDLSANVVVDQHDVDSDASLQLMANSGSLFAIGNDSPLYANYDLKSSFGPLTAPYGDTYASSGSFATTSGQSISFNNPSTNTTFQAMPAATAVTPEPSTLCLLGTGLITAAGTLRRRLRA